MLLRAITLDTNFEMFLDLNHYHTSGSAISKILKEKAFDPAMHPEWPNSYCVDNTTIYLADWSRDQVDFEDFGRQLGIEVIMVSSIMQPPGNVYPVHCDFFQKIREQHPDRPDNLVRANIHASDWQPGHFLSASDQVYTNWKKGQGVLWDSKVPHASANAGLVPKFTVQVSGFLT